MKMQERGRRSLETVQKYHTAKIGNLKESSIIAAGSYR